MPCRARQQQQTADAWPFLLLPTLLTLAKDSLPHHEQPYYLLL